MSKKKAKKRVPRKAGHTSKKKVPKKRKRPEFTPRECAHSLTIGWIHHMVKGRTSDLAEQAPCAYRRQVKRQLIKLHNKLLDQSGLDGVYLEEEE